MVNIQDIKALALHEARGTAPTNFTVDEVSKSLFEEITEIVTDYYSWKREKNTIFEILSEVIAEVAPKSVISALGAFAEVRYIKNGQRLSFKSKAVGKQRAKSTFLTQAAVSGVYETFRLDSRDFEVKTHAMGIGAYIDFERYLSGDESIADYMETITEAFEDNVYIEIHRALVQAFSNTTRPAANKDTSANFDPAKMRALINTAKSYGNGAVIYATPAFVAEMADHIDYSPLITAKNTVSATDIEDLRTKGAIQMFYGCPIVQIPQSFTDETNATTVLDDQYAFIFPTNGEKIVKVVFEGTPIVKDFENRDNSYEIHAYMKLGVGILSHNNWCIYQVTSLSA